jgi:hypothetical protein
MRLAAVATGRILDTRITKFKQAPEQEIHPSMESQLQLELAITLMPASTVILVTFLGLSEFTTTEVAMAARAAVQQQATQTAVHHTMRAEMAQGDSYWLRTLAHEDVA